MFRSQDIAIDLGTASILVYTKEKGVVFYNTDYIFCALYSIIYIYAD